MNIFVAAILGLFVFSVAIATGTTTTAPNTNTEHLMVFQIIQKQMIFDSSTVESATIVSPENTTELYGLQLKLKTSAANHLGELTGENIDKRANIILDNMVLSSPVIRSKLGAEFIITGLTKDQAEQFIKSLSKQ